MQVKTQILQQTKGGILLSGGTIILTVKKIYETVKNQRRYKENSQKTKFHTGVFPVFIHKNKIS